MSGSLEVHFIAIHNYKEKIARFGTELAGAETIAKDLSVSGSAFGNVPNSKKVGKAWANAVRARQAEVTALRGVLSGIEAALVRILAAYGITDAEIARRLRKGLE